MRLSRCMASPTPGSPGRPGGRVDARLTCAARRMTQPAMMPAITIPACLAAAFIAHQSLVVSRVTARPAPQFTAWIHIRRIQEVTVTAWIRADPPSTPSRQEAECPMPGACLETMR
ncbi:hypothetical protein BOS5A_10679 [Bosea sp. EC-HK365B]|nr:hypothetical protein BOS5A_10679 [Bosea sp. EC-HK365B]VXC53278.1 hypothetical protein BOSE127_190367 [Bosea sp. 127]